MVTKFSMGSLMNPVESVGLGVDLEIHLWLTRFK